MNTKLWAALITAAALLAPAAWADDQDKDVKGKASDKASDLTRKTHEKICQGNHGTVTSKSDNSVTIDGKQYALTADTRVNKQEEALLTKAIKSGDTVCFTTEKASDGSQQIAQLIAIPKDTDKVRVREKQSDSPDKVDVETPKKNDVK